MDRAAPQSAPLSLQDKLDRITHDRKVLDVLRTLMRQGLREGDEVQHRADGGVGRVIVIRSAAEPQAVVERADGMQLAYRAADWKPRA